MKMWTPMVPLAAAAAVTGLTIALVQGAKTPVTTLENVTQAAVADNDPGAPSYLPSSASLDRVDRDQHGIVRQYALAGKANEDTMSPLTLAATPTKVHPATRLSVYYVPALRDADVLLDPAFFDQVSVDVNGVQGTLTTPKSGLGVIRVDWVDSADAYHVVITERLTTPEGMAGLPADEMLKVARSVR